MNVNINKQLLEYTKFLDKYKVTINPDTRTYTLYNIFNIEFTSFNKMFSQSEIYDEINKCRLLFKDILREFYNFIAFSIPYDNEVGIQISYNYNDENKYNYRIYTLKNLHVLVDEETLLTLLNENRLEKDLEISNELQKRINNK